MGGLATITLGDVIRALRRYQPVAIGLVVLLAAFAVLPKPDHVEGALGDSGSLLDQTRASTGRPAASTPGTATATAPAAAPGVSDGSITPMTFPTAATSSSFSSGGTSGVGSSSPSSSSSEAFPSSDEPAVTFDGPSIDSDTAATGAPLRIVGSTWATRQAGTPLAQNGVPAGTLPVGFRVTDDKLSFVRLEGEQTVLTLVEEPTGTRENNGPIAVQICAVTTEWQDGEAIAIQDAPQWDAGSCTLGTRDAGTGTWTFDLSSFPSATDPKGFALVPGEGGGLDFQVAFKKSA